MKLSAIHTIISETNDGFIIQHSNIDALNAIKQHMLDLGFTAEFVHINHMDQPRSADQLCLLINYSDKPIANDEFPDAHLYMPTATATDNIILYAGTNIKISLSDPLFFSKLDAHIRKHQATRPYYDDRRI